MAVNIVLILMNIAVIIFMQKKGNARAVITLVLFLVFSADLSYNSYVSFIALNGEGEDINRFYERYDDIRSATDYIKSNDDSLYRMEKDFYRTPNDTMMFDYIGITHSSSCEKESVRHFLSRFGFRDTGLSAFYNLGSTTFADCFLIFPLFESKVTADLISSIEFSNIPLPADISAFIESSFASCLLSFVFKIIFCIVFSESAVAPISSCF